MSATDPVYYGPADLFTGSAAHTTGTTATTVKAALTANSTQRYVVTDLTISNGSATAVLVTLKDGAASPVTLWQVYLLAGAILTKSFRKPLVATAEKALTIVSDQTVSTVYVSVSGFIENRSR